MTTPTPPPEPADELIARFDAAIGQLANAFSFDYGIPAPRAASLVRGRIEPIITDVQALLTSQQRELAELRRPTSGETPRTDKAIKCNGGHFYVTADFARQLERELAAANARVAELDREVKMHMGSVVLLAEKPRELAADLDAAKATLSTLRTELARVTAERDEGKIDRAELRTRLAVSETALAAAQAEVADHLKANQILFREIKERDAATPPGAKE